jgi:glucokinase
MYIGIDIGGTNTRVGLIDKKSPSRITQLLKFKTARKYTETCTKLIESIQELIDPAEIEGIGIGLPGLVNSPGGEIISLTNLPDWNGKPLKDTLHKELGAEIKIENDAACAGICELLYGAGKGAAKFLYITWGTGIGGKGISSSEEGVFIQDMEPGHQILEPDGQICACGQRGCLEEMIGGRAIEKRFGVPPEKIEGAVLEEIAGIAAIGFLNTVIHYPVGLMVVNGGVFIGKPQLAENIQEIIKAKMKKYEPFEIRLSKFNGDGGIIGAAGLFFVNIRS